MAAGATGLAFTCRGPGAFPSPVHGGGCTLNLRDPGLGRGRGAFPQTIGKNHHDGDESCTAQSSGFHVGRFSLLPMKAG